MTCRARLQTKKIVTVLMYFWTPQKLMSLALQVETKLVMQGETGR